MWKIVGKPEVLDWIKFEPVEVLDEFDFPRLFTCKSISGQQFLAYNCDFDKASLRFLLVPCHDDLLYELKRGFISLRDALSANQAWIFDLDNTWTPISAWQVDVDSLPYDALPRPGAMLRTEMPKMSIANPTRVCSSIVILTAFPPQCPSRRVVAHA